MNLESDTNEPGTYGGRLSKKRKILFGVAVVVVVGVTLGSAVAMGLFSAGNPGRHPEGIGIEGAVTITLYGPNGQTLGVWKTHNSLVQGGVSEVVLCLSSQGPPSSAPGTAYCPGSTYFDSSTPVPSYTAVIGIAISSCTNAYTSCGIFSAATNTLAYGPSGCPCTGWTATATFGPSQLACSSTCSLNDVASGQAAYGTRTPSGFSQFDDIPSSNFPSSISISAGDSLAINIQFTVS